LILEPKAIELGHLLGRPEVIADVRHRRVDQRTHGAGDRRRRLIGSELLPPDRGCCRRAG